jgi:hypothetical protein
VIPAAVGRSWRIEVSACRSIPATLCWARRGRLVLARLGARSPKITVLTALMRLLAGLLVPRGDRRLASAAC